MTFQDLVLQQLKKVPKGKVTTYKSLAHKLKSKAYRAVGTALNKNPNPIKVPCHRVINSDGRVGKYALGQKKKIKLLMSEGIEIKNNKIDLNKFGI